MSGMAWDLFSAHPFACVIVKRPMAYSARWWRVCKTQLLALIILYRATFNWEILGL
jgi:hypothetical protein